MKNNFGFNLLTMTAIILALGIIMSAVLGFYNINNIKRRVFQTRKSFSEIELAIQDYVFKNKRFPCPSSLNCNSDGCENNDDKFGSEKRDLNDNCIYENSNSAIFKTTNDNSEIVLYGAIPFLTLGLANNYSVDAWGNKIVYMIPLSLTKNNAFQKLISEKNTGDDLEYLKDDIIYILMSFGRNRQGAYQYDNLNSNYFSGVENMPVNNFEINDKNKNYLYFIKNYEDFEIKGLDSEVIECEELVVENAFNDVIDTKTKCVEFNYIGSQQTFNPVDYGLSVGDVVKLEVWGAQGGSSSSGGAKSSGGLGGYATGTLTLNSDIIYIYVGGKGSDNQGSLSGSSGGYNGGGRGGSSSWGGGGGGAGGGGATDIRIGGTSLSNRIIVAGGGGGGAKTDNVNYGNGGSANIGDGGDSAKTITGGKSGANGGKGGAGSSVTGNNGTSGNGGSGGRGPGYYGGGGGGGGYLGGGAGGGGGMDGSFVSGGGGGSGSSYTGGVSNGSVLDSVQSGNGKAKICYDSESFTSKNLTFPKAKFGEISFSKELCPRNVNYPAKINDYYYISTYKDSKGVVIENRAGKRCGKNGKWENGYVYECIKLNKCQKPSSVLLHSSKDWSDFEFSIVNTGVVYDKDHKIEMKCIVNNDGAKWYENN